MPIRTASTHTAGRFIGVHEGPGVRWLDWLVCAHTLPPPAMKGVAGFLGWSGSVLRTCSEYPLTLMWSSPQSSDSRCNASSALAFFLTRSRSHCVLPCLGVDGTHGNCGSQSTSPHRVLISIGSMLVCFTPQTTARFFFSSVDSF